MRDGDVGAPDHRRLDNSAFEGWIDRAAAVSGGALHTTHRRASSQIFLFSQNQNQRPLQRVYGSGHVLGPGTSRRPIAPCLRKPSVSNHERAAATGNGW